MEEGSKMDLGGRGTQRPSKRARMAINILEIGLIVETVAKHLDFANLKVFRQTSRSCYWDSLPAWRKKACIKFRHSAATGPSLTEFNQYVLERYDGVDTMDTNGVIPYFPFQKFSFKDWSTSTQELQMFAVLCASNIKYLELVDFHFKDDAAADDFFTTLRMLTEHVQTLKVKCCISVGIRRHSRNSLHCEHFLPKLFSNICHLPKLRSLNLELCERVKLTFIQKCPNLKELVVNDSRVNTSHIWAPLLESAEMNRHPPQIRNRLLTLTTFDALGTKVVPEELVKADFPLRHLAVDVSNWLPVHLSNVLSHYGRNLVTLKVLTGPFQFGNCQLPTLTSVFQNLIELELWGDNMSSLNFLINTPCLARLKISCSGFGNPVATRQYYPFLTNAAKLHVNLVGNSSVLLKTENFSVPSLREFVTDCRLEADSWMTLKDWWPNLRVLEAPILDNFTFGVICGHWERLEILCLRFGSVVDDHAIIGGQNNVGPVYPGISNLKCLNTFELEVECGRGRLTDRSAEQGFLNLQYLRSIKIGVAGGHFTDGIKMRLEMNVADVEVYRTCSKTSAGEKVLRCCKWADFKRQ